MDLIRERGQVQGSGPLTRTIVKHNGVRVSYWRQRRAMRELPLDGDGWVKNVEFTESKLPYLLNIDHRSPEMFGRVMSLERDEDGTIQMGIFHPGEWERLLKTKVPVTVH